MISTEEILLSELLAAILRGQILDAAEEQQLHDLLNKYPQARLLLKKLLEDGKIIAKLNWANFSADKQWEKFLSEHEGIIKREKVRAFRFWLRGIASSILLIAGIYVIWSIYLKTNSLEYIIKDDVHGQRNDVLPGGSMAILQLENGRQLILDSSRQKIDLSGLEINDNELVYDSSLVVSNLFKHKLVIPTRAVYHIQLSDGTRVWLNSESELAYYPNFNKKERRVHLKGEAYFMVAKDQNRPFIVDNDGLEVQALGTEFNVNAYGNNARVALLEGKLRVTSSDQQIEIGSGKEVRKNNGQLKAVAIRDTAEVTAWKRNTFYFGHKNLEQILQEIERWYGVEVALKPGLNLTNQYEGAIQKNASLGQVCEVLSYLTGYRYVIAKNKLAVQPKKERN